ncbi:MAG: TIGR03618 family F420-dependent PPOX class oxidoreductase [Chloroflexota bacterium]
MTAGGLGPVELDALLRRPVLGRLATIDPDGYPAIVPIWFEWDGHAILLVARGRARYLDDIRREPRVAFSVVADDDPDVRVHLRGRAEIVTDAAPLEGETLALARRLTERYEGPAGLDYIDASRSLERCVVRIVPDRTISWGSPDWHPRYRDPDPGGPDDRV